MSEPCSFCGKSVNPHDLSTYKQVSGWVHGKKSDGMTLREDTGKYAHEACILKAQAGHAPGDPEMFSEAEEVQPRFCDHLANKGTGVGTCLGKLDEHGQCPNTGNHTELDFW